MGSPSAPIGAPSANADSFIRQKELPALVRGAQFGADSHTPLRESGTVLGASLMTHNGAARSCVGKLLFSGLSLWRFPRRATSAAFVPILGTFRLRCALCDQMPIVLDICVMDEGSIAASIGRARAARAGRWDAHGPFTRWFHENARQLGCPIASRHASCGRPAAFRSIY